MLLDSSFSNGALSDRDWVKIPKNHRTPKSFLVEI